MQTLQSVPRAWLTKLRGLLFDLDDTFLDHGRLLPSALQALYELRAAGFELYVVTGRPASWGAVVTHQWPVDGAVTENGAVTFLKNEGRVRLFDSVAPAERERRRARLQGVVGELRVRHPELVAADDVAGRVSDFTFDIGEHQQVDPEVVMRVRRSARELGASTTASSVHLHVSLDRADKASGSVRVLAERYELDPTVVLSRYAFIGDSENDAACFAAFRLSIGVQNLSGRPTLRPRFLTSGARAQGFVQTAELLLARGSDLG